MSLALTLSASVSFSSDYTSFSTALDGASCGVLSGAYDDVGATPLTESRDSAPSFCGGQHLSTGQDLKTLARWSFLNVGRKCLDQIWAEIEYLVMVDESSERSKTYLEDIEVLKETWKTIDTDASEIEGCSEDLLTKIGRKQRFTHYLYLMQDRYISDHQNLFMAIEDAEFERPFVWAAGAFSPFLIWLMLRKPQVAKEVAKLTIQDENLAKDVAAIAGGIAGAPGLKTAADYTKKILRSFTTKTLKRIGMTLSPSQWGSFVARSGVRNSVRASLVQGGGELATVNSAQAAQLKNLIELIQIKASQSPLLLIAGEMPYYNNYQDVQFSNVLLAGVGGTLASVSVEALSLFLRGIRVALGLIGGSPGVGLFALTVGSTIYLEKTMDKRRFDFWNSWTYQPQANAVAAMEGSESDDYLKVSELYSDLSNELVYQAVAFQTQIAPRLTQYYRDLVCTTLAQPAGLRPPPDEKRYENPCGSLPHLSEEELVQELGPLYQKKDRFGRPMPLPLILPTPSKIVSQIIACQTQEVEATLESIADPYRYRMDELDRALQRASSNSRFKLIHFAPILSKLESYKQQLKRQLEVGRRVVLTKSLFEEDKGRIESIIANADQDRQAYLDLHRQYSCPLVNLE